MSFNIGKFFYLFSSFVGVIKVLQEPSILQESGNLFYRSNMLLPVLFVSANSFNADSYS